MKKRRIKGLEKYSNQWVALDPQETRVIAGGKSLKEVIKRASLKTKKPTFMRVPPLDVNFSP